MASNVNRKPLLLDDILPAFNLDTSGVDQTESSENISTSKPALRTGNLGGSIKISSIRINELKDRIFILSPKVKSGQDRESNMEDFYLLEENIKYGCLGNLITSIHKVSKVKYALKIIKKEEIIGKNFVEKINTFIDTNYRSTNANIIKFINHFEEDNHLVFIYSLMKINLLEFVEKQYSKDDYYENHSMQYFIQVVGGVLFLHNNKKFNIDIRPENIMIDKQNIIKITDLKNKEIINNFFLEKNESEKLNIITNQSSSISANLTYSEISTIKLDYYTTPEELLVYSKNDSFEFQNLEKNDKEDVWRLGALLYHLVVGRPPYQIFDTLGILSNNSTSTLQKKANFLKNFFEEKKICVDSTHKFSEVEQNMHNKENSNQNIDSMISMRVSLSHGSKRNRKKNEDTEKDLIEKKFDINHKENDLDIKHHFSTEFRQKVEVLMCLFMEKNISKRSTMKEFKENQCLKLLLSKYKINSSPALITKSTPSEIRESTKTGNLNTLIQKSYTSRSGGETLFNSLKMFNSCESFKNIGSSNNLISESKEFDNLTFEFKVKILLEENSVFKKENEKLRFHNLRLENENKIFSSELNFVKISFDKDRKSIEEEKKRMNTLNQDRISKINELDELTNEIIELKSKLRLLENDNDMLQFDIKESSEMISNLEKKIEEMNQNFENERSEYNIKFDNLNKNLKRFQKYYLGDPNEISNYFKDDESIKKFAVALFDLVKEFKETLDKFIIGNFTDKAEILYSINQMLGDKEEMIKSYINKVKEDFMDDYIRISMKPINSTRSDRSRERFEWIQKQVIELTPFKIKSVNLEKINNKLISENKIKAEAIKLNDIEIELLKKLNQGLNENIKINTDYISLLESKLGYIKDFVFKNLPFCLDELKI